MRLSLCPKCKKFFSPDGQWQVEEEEMCTCPSNSDRKAEFYVQGEIQPYKSMITGEMITSRTQHKAHMKQHGVMEAGNEKKYFMNIEKAEIAKEQDIKRREYEKKHGPITDKQFENRKRTLQ